MQTADTAFLLCILCKKYIKINIYIWCWYDSENPLRWMCFTLQLLTLLVGRVHSTPPCCTTWPRSSARGNAVFPISAHLQQEARCHSSPCCSLLWTSWYVHLSGKDR